MGNKGERGMIWVADIGSNHNASLARALELIREAYKVGANYVKFQLFDNSIGKPVDEWLPIKWLPILSEEAHKLGMKFGCTPFYEKAVSELEPYVDFYKLTSNYNMVHKLFDKCFATGKSIICSFPPERLEIKPCMHTLAAIPLYPTPLDKVHLGEINWDVFDGWADHTHNAGVIYRVVHHYGAKVVEFHIDLQDAKGWESCYGHCWLPSEIKTVIDTINEGIKAN